MKWLIRFFRRLFKHQVLTIECWTRCENKQVELRAYTISGTVGAKLYGYIGGTVRVIDCGECPDQDHFWVLWRHFNLGVDFTWQDGSTII